jgi:branched-subunit amino acid transport protein
MMVPTWLHDLSIAYLLLGAACAIAIAADEIRHPQHMWIMNLVWPVTALFGSAWIVWQYFSYGRLATHEKAHAAMERHEEPPNKRLTPFPVMVANGTLHCGSGCTLGDICAEWLVFAVPAIAVAFGWHSVFGEKMFAVWIVDYLFAYAFGIVFQYFTIAPMRGLSFGQGIAAAIKADTLSLTAWQIGMYGFMAIADFVIFRKALGAALETDTVEFWFMMQIAMICGFATSYPVNWWLLRSGVKEEM